MKSILRFYYHLYNSVSNRLSHVYFRLRRGRAHPSVRFAGCPLLRCGAGSSVIIGEGVRINSKLSANPMASGQCTRLIATEPGATIEIGRNVGISSASISAAKKVTIGDYTLIGADVIIADTDFHTLGPAFSFTNDSCSRARPIQIGKACFLGTRAIILKGVTLGEGVIVAAGAVVSKDVPPYHLASGNPATHQPLPSHWQRDAQGNPMT